LFFLSDSKSARGKQQKYKSREEHERRSIEQLRQKHSQSKGGKGLRAARKG
jgi:hypothetical protein